MRASEILRHSAVRAAEQLATRAHSNQVRKFSADPYIRHPRDVFELFLEWVERRVPALSYDDIIVGACACWLHDVKEDCQAPDSDPFITDEEIIASCMEYGGRAFKIVCELTNPSQAIVPRPSRHVRKRIDREHIARSSLLCRTIKAIDRKANLADMHGCDDSDFLSLYCMESKRLTMALHGVDEYLLGQLTGEIRKLELRIKEMDAQELCSWTSR